jgi:hypothetical protein
MFRAKKSKSIRKLLTSTTNYTHPDKKPQISKNFLFSNRMIGNEEVCHTCSKDTHTTPRTSSEAKSSNRHSLVTSGNPFIRPQHPVVPHPPPIENAPLPPMLQLGRDGRVRPITQNRARNPK